VQPRLRLALALGVSVLLGTGATALVGPAPPTLADAPVTGDADLAARAVAALGPEGVRALSVAFIDTTAPAPERVRLAAVGTTASPGGEPVDPSTPFETGSVAKALDGLLLAHMVEAGEVRLEERVGDLVPDSPLAADGDATLQELATHRSGLPRLSRSALLSGFLSAYTGGDPYSGEPADLLEDAAGAGAPGGAEPSYSNLGAAVLGRPSPSGRTSRGPTCSPSGSSSPWG